MKIVIPKPISWVGPYQLVDKILWFVNEDRRFDIGTSLAKGGIMTICEKIHGWRETRAQKRTLVRIDPWDTWNVDGTLSEFMPQLLKQLRDTKHGVPMAFVKGDEVIEESEERYNKALDAMIWSFKNQESDDEERLQKGLHLFATHYNTLWD